MLGNRIFISLISIFSLFYTIQASDIAVVTMAVGSDYKKIVAPCLENKKAYCQAHGYDFICIEEKVDKQKPLTWTKVKSLDKILSSYKWVLWTDANSLIMNPAIKLENLLDDQCDLLIGEDKNSSVFLIKNSDISHRFLRAIATQKDSLCHPSWEKQAFILELEMNRALMKTRLLRQRTISSYTKEVDSTIDHNRQEYHKGDFLLVFEGSETQLENPENQITGQALANLVVKYAAEVPNAPQIEAPKVEDPLLVDLADYLKESGFDGDQGKDSEKDFEHEDPVLVDLEDYLKDSGFDFSEDENNITEEEKKDLYEDLSKFSGRTVAKIGFNAGFSTEAFFQFADNEIMITAFDVKTHPHTMTAVEFMKKKYKKRFQFFGGDPDLTVQAYAKKYPNKKFDLIYIDGDHIFDIRFEDMVNCSLIAHKDTVIWINDDWKDIGPELDLCQKEGLIEIIGRKSSKDTVGGREWIIAKYRLN